MKRGRELCGASVLVTGSPGMLGRSLRGRLAARNSLIGVSKSGREGSLRCDLSQRSAVEKLFSRKFNLVIHTAAYSDVDGCEEDPRRAHEANALATKYLAEHCGRKDIAFVYISTDYVFDGRKRSPYVEPDPTCPVNIYGMTKLEGEHWTKRLVPLSAVVRTSWLFGEGNPASFVNRVAHNLRTQPLVRALDDQEDSPTSTEDLAEAVERIGVHLLSERRSSRPVQQLFHVCNSGSTTRYGLALVIREDLGLKDVKLEKMERADMQGRLAVRPAYGVMSSARYEHFFGVRMRSWEDSLEDYLNRL